MSVPPWRKALLEFSEEYLNEPEPPTVPHGGSALFLGVQYTKNDPLYETQRTPVSYVSDKRLCDMLESVRLESDVENTHLFTLLYYMIFSFPARASVQNALRCLIECKPMRRMPSVSPTSARFLHSWQYPNQCFHTSGVQCDAEPHRFPWRTFTHNSVQSEPLYFMQALREDGLPVSVSALLTKCCEFDSTIAHPHLIKAGSTVQKGSYLYKVCLPIIATHQPKYSCLTDFVCCCTGPLHHHQRGRMGRGARDFYSKLTHLQIHALDTRTIAEEVSLGIRRCRYAHALSADLLSPRVLWVQKSL